MINRLFDSQVVPNQMLSLTRLIPRVNITQQSLPLNQMSSLVNGDTPSQLELILAKLVELDNIKMHLNTIDSRLNLLQPQSLISGTVANRS